MPAERARWWTFERVRTRWCAWPHRRDWSRCESAEDVAMQNVHSVIWAILLAVQPASRFRAMGALHGLGSGPVHPLGRPDGRASAH